MLMVNVLSLYVGTYLPVHTNFAISLTLDVSRGGRITCSCEYIPLVKGARH